MKTIEEINVDFNQAIRQAEALEDAAREMKQAAVREFDELLQDVSASWKGETAAAFIRKGRLLKERICKNAVDLERIARVIRNAAQRYYDAEMRIHQIAQKREY